MDGPTPTLAPEPLTPRPLPPEPQRRAIVWTLSVLHVLLVMGLVLLARVPGGPLEDTPFVLLRLVFKGASVASIASVAVLLAGTIGLTHLLHRIGRPAGALLLHGALLGAAFGLLMLVVIMAAMGPNVVALALLYGAHRAAFSGAVVGAALAGIDAALLRALNQAR